jgi:protein-tyrosine-phosphatase
MAATILVVGAADTGRAPITAALLRLKLAERGAQAEVASAGVLGHDGDPPTAEALATMDQLGIDLASHTARTLTDEIVDAAALLLAVDSGTARVAKLRFPAASERTLTLGTLAGRQRDIPDPFKMQLGAWLAYAREIDALLAAAMPRILEYLPAEQRAGTSALANPQAELVRSTPPVAPERTAAATRIAQLLRLAAQMPGVVDWQAARTQIEAELTATAAQPAVPSDLVAAYAGLLRAALALTPPPPSPGKLTALAEAATHLAVPVGQEELDALSRQIGGWPAL